MSTGTRRDIVGQIVGMLVFLVGVGLLVAVFIYAFRLFGAKPADALGLSFTGDPKKDPTVSKIGFQFGWLMVRIALLFVMALAASLISQRGINLYFSAHFGPQAATKTPPIAS